MIPPGESCLQILLHRKQSTEPEYKKLNQEVCDLADRLKENLSPENQSVLDEMLRKIYTAQCIVCESYFCFALATGIQLQTEIQTQLKYLGKVDV